MSERTGALIHRKHREYLIPLLLTAFAFSFGSLSENMIIGHLLDDSALSAVAAAAPPIMCMEMIYLLFCVGGVTQATISLGKLEYRKANLIFTFTITGVLATMLLFCLFAGSFLPAFVGNLANGDAEISELTVQYLQPLLIAFPFRALACTIAAFISADGNPRYTCAIIIVSTAIQLLLCLVFIGIMDLGIRGAALGALAGNVAGCIMILPYLRKKKLSFHFSIPRLRDLKLLGSIVKAGFNTAWMTVCQLLSFSFLIVVIAFYIGPDGLPVLTVCMNMTLIVDIIISAVVETMLPIAGSLLGEQDYFGLRQLVKSSLKTLVLTAVALSVAFSLLPGFTGRIFGIDTNEILVLAKKAVRMYALCLPLHALSTFMHSYYNVIGFRKYSSLLTLLKNLLFIIPSALILVGILPEIVWLCYFFSEFGALIMMFLISWIIKKKNGLQSMLLPPESRNHQHFDFTITSDIYEAEKLIGRILEFGKSSGANKNLINHIAVAIEEMIVATTNYAHSDAKKGLIDVMIHIADDRVSVRLRDNGSAFNPVEYTPEENTPYITDGIELIKKMADELHYSRRLGFNTTIMYFSIDKTPEPHQAGIQCSHLRCAD